MAEDKKIALITGANRGIGFETARQLGKKGITVIVGARKLSDAEQTAAKLKEEGIDAHGVQLDVTKAADRSAVAQYLSKTFGKLDILINNAGMISSDGLTSQTADEALQAVYQTNLFSVVAVTRELLPLLKNSPAGRIVNLSSILGSLTLRADPKSPIASSKNFAYNSSKAALNVYTIHLADELKGTPVKVNSAHPGWVKTEMGTDAAPMENSGRRKNERRAGFDWARWPERPFYPHGEGTAVVSAAYFKRLDRKVRRAIAFAGARP